MIGLVQLPNQIRKCDINLYREMKYPLSTICDIALDHGKFNNETIF